MVAGWVSLLSGLVSLNTVMAMANSQGNIQKFLSSLKPAESQSWKVTISQDWDVLGPFPIHAREQHFLSPSFPINLTEPIDLDASWPSSYADGGSVGWTKAQLQEDGGLEVSFPNIRWESLCATEGWAAFQHHNILRSTLTVYPPALTQSRRYAHGPRLLVTLRQGTFFTILPGTVTDIEKDTTVSSVPEWHAGNVYAMGRSPPNAVHLPAPPSLTSPTTYEIIVSGDYEIRLFGDPRNSGTQVPKLSINISAKMDDTNDLLVPVIHDPSHDIVCDFVAGWAFGDALGIGLLSRSDWWTVVSVSAAAHTTESIEFSLLQETRIAPSQRRIVPVKLTQKQPIQLDALKLVLTLKSDQSVSAIYVNIPVQHHGQWTASKTPSTGIKASYFFSTSTPTAFLVTPPEKTNAGIPVPPILALHGAGVDIFGSDFWIKALPRQHYSWVIAPTGRTEWGLDWHGPSARDAWDTVEALHIILDERDEWRKWGLVTNSKVLLMGHSNGGQGAWYVAARNPDRVVGVVPAAGYIKSQSYVPWVQSRSAHYVDPGLRAILDSSLTPDDNDLFLSNLIDTPIFAIHGGDDDNVPVWHTREAVSVLRTWNPHANVTFREDSGQPHWYDTVFSNKQVECFVSSTLGERSATITAISRSFTLTVAVPADSGSLHGWKIHSLDTPGRLARLVVHIQQDAIQVRTTNVKAFSTHLHSLPEDIRNARLVVNGQTFELDEETWDLPDFSFGLTQEAGTWIPTSLSAITPIPPTGRISNFLASDAPINIVVPTRSSSPELSAALRLAHNLNVYHKLDTDILDSDEATAKFRNHSLGQGNIVVLGHGKLDGFAAAILKHNETPFRLRESIVELRGRPLSDQSMATLFLHPHPTHSTSLVLFVYGADVSGLERGLHLFPLRTGVTVPDWIVIGSHADDRGSGGVEGAGVWGNDWSWNEPMSAF